LDWAVYKISWVLLWDKIYFNIFITLYCSLYWSFLMPYLCSYITTRVYFLFILPFWYAMPSIGFLNILFDFSLTAYYRLMFEFLWCTQILEYRYIWIASHAVSNIFSCSYSLCSLESLLYSLMHPLFDFYNDIIYNFSFTTLISNDIEMNVFVRTFFSRLLMITFMLLWSLIFLCAPSVPRFSWEIKHWSLSLCA